MTLAEVEHRYRPRGAAVRLFECRDAEVLLSGPAGTGKSRACLEKLHLLALLNPGMRGLLVRKTLASLGSTALVTWRTYVVPEALANGTVVYYGGSSEEPPQYRYSNGSRIVIGGLDKSTKIMSSDYDVIFVQEAIELTEADWENLTTRLRNGVISFQQLMADTNPSTPTHWLKVRCDRGQTAVLESRHEDNPLYVDESGEKTPAGGDYIEGKLDKLTGPRKARLRHGKWVAAEGVIYETFDDAVHVVDRFWVPKGWERWWVIDFGYTNPFVCQWWAEDPDGRLILYREIYRTRRLVEDHARDMLWAVTRAVKGQEQLPRDEVLRAVQEGRREWKEPEPRGIICDHDAEGRGTLERHLGMSTVPASKSVTEGIEAVMSRLSPAGDGLPRLTIMRDTVIERDGALEEAKRPCSTAEEIPGYIWKPTPDGKPQKDEPLKQDDHGCDCTRYLVMERDMGAEPGVRWLTD